MRRTLHAAAMAAALAAAVSAGPAGASNTRVVYDDFSSNGADYNAKWAAAFGPGEGTTSFTGARFNVRAVPFTTGADYSVFDHLKYIRTSTAGFPVPAGHGSVTFESDIRAATPGTVDGLVQQGIYAPSGTWTQPGLKPPGFANYRAGVLQGQQAGAVMNMVDFCSGQLFDWFIAGNTAFPLIERLPSNVTGNAPNNPNCPGATVVGRSLMYTQIIKEIRVRPGVAHHVSITYTHTGGSEANVVYELDGQRVAKVNHVGIPLDRRGRDGHGDERHDDGDDDDGHNGHWSGTYPSLGPGERLGNQINSLTIGHGLFSLIDAFPFQHPESPELSVSIPVGTGNPADAGRARLFGQGADASFDNFVVTTKG
ncbi:MAG: hypothetical protein QOG68_1915 [Solirubrobacteraceae bacterium]|nr:hypothetical protein [Solirubrobacteraceae bacterium]